MKIRFERGGVVLECEHQPMKEGRFRTLCAFAAAGIYAGLVIAVAALCGVPGVAVVGLVTLFAIMIIKGI